MSTYEPKTAFEKWLYERLPVMDLVSHMTDFPTPRNLNYFWTFGGILTFCLMTQIITGIVLFMHYTAHEQMAFDSVEMMRRDVNFGWWIQNVHMVGASMFFAAMYLHIFRGLYYGSYKAPREIIWIFGVIILLCLMATAFMGYVLPWGQMSIWGATVITNFFSAVPLVGDTLLEWVRGGFAVGNPTLNRFASLHYLLPFIILGLVVLHIWALHVPGNNNPTGLDVQSDKDTLPFHPYYTVKDFFAIIVFLIFFAWFVFYAPNLLGHPDNYIKANPLVTPPHIVPEWYFLPFYAILRAVPDKLGGVVLMFGSIAILFVLPWLDRSKIRSATYRPVYRILFWIFVISCIALTYLGAMPAEGGYVIAARIFTLIYFGFFFILPFLPRFEIEREVPKSIADSVLGDSKS